KLKLIYSTIIMICLEGNMSQEPKKVGRRTFLNYAIAIIATGVIVGAATYFAVPKGEVTVTAPGTTITTTKTVTTIVGTPTTSPTTTTVPWAQYFPRPGTILKKWELDWTGWNPDEYLTTVDWVRTIDWDKVKQKYSGETVTMACEGVDISAPQTYQPTFQNLTGANLQLFGIPPETLHEKLMAEFTAGTGRYDTAELFGAWAQAYFPYMIDVKPFAEQYGISIKDIHPVFRMMNTGPNGELLGLVEDADLHVFLVRKNLLEKAGLSVPKTWDEVIEACKVLKPIGEKEGWYPWIIYFCAKGFLTFWYWENIALQFKDVTLTRPDSWEPNFIGDEEGGVRALEIIKELLKYSPPGSLNNTYELGREQWLAGLGAMTTSHQCWPRQSFDPELSKISPLTTGNVIEVYPYPQGTTRREPCNWTTTYLGIPKTSKKQELAFLWSVVMCSQESSALMGSHGTGVESGFVSVISNPKVWKGQPAYKVVWETAWTAATEPFVYIPEAYAIEEAAGAEIYRYLEGSEPSAKQALKNAEEKVRSILQKAGYLVAGKKPGPFTVEDFCKMFNEVNPKP
ncbi:MAG: extracellular solute-binding protein, partial [Nitrososphaeria archaeon]